MIRYLLIILSLLHCISAYGQINIQGKILDPEAKPMVSVNITIKNTAELNRILGFAISKPAGNFSIKLNSSPDSLLITVSKIGYTTKELIVPGQSQTINFTLEKGDIMLKEIVVQAPPIRRRGDTLSYKVEEFQSASDRSIGDVIKKLPGIEISENGQILYQGKPINRYYIENLNLLDGRYGLVNDNLPHGKVATVQVFENHQPIRALDSLHFSETAAINIKLRNKVTYTGTIHYGAGYKPFIWDVNITPMLFVPNLQFLGSFQSNSSGNSLVRQFFNFETVMFQNWLNVPPIVTPPFSQQRWLDNQSHAASINALKKTKKDLELKLNVSLILEEQKQRGDYNINYLLTNETVRYSENTYNRFGENQFSASLQTIKNQKKRYFKNSLNFEKQWNADNGLNKKETRTYTQSNNTDNLKLSNNFHKIFTKNSLTYNFYSNVGYQESHQSLAVHLLGADTLANPVQNFRHKSFNAHNYLSFSKYLFKTISASIQLGSNIDLSKINSELVGYPAVSDSINNFKWNTYKTYLSASLNYSFKKWLISLNSPLTYTIGQYNQETIQRMAPEPSLTLRYKRNTNLEFIVGSQYNNTFSQLGDLYSGSIMTSYLNLVNRDSDFRNTHNYTIRGGLKYNEVISGISFNLNYSYTQRVQNLVSETTINPDGTTEMVYTPLKNTSENHYANFLFTKYFFKIKTSATVGISYSNNTTQRFINQEFKEYLSTNYVPNFKLSYNGIKWLEFNYKSTLTQSKNSSRELVQFHQKSGLVMSRLKNILLTYTFEHFNQKAEVSTQNFFFSDMMVRYTLPKSNKDFEIVLVNLFNQKSFTSYFISDYFVQQSTFRLRPRQFILRGRISI